MDINYYASGSAVTGISQPESDTGWLLRRQRQKNDKTSLMCPTGSTRDPIVLSIDSLWC